MSHHVHAATGKGLRLMAREDWSVGAADKYVVVQIPDGCLPHARSVKEIIGLGVAVEIARPLKLPCARNGGPVSAADKHVVIQIPNRGLARVACKSK